MSQQRRAHTILKLGVIGAAAVLTLTGCSVFGGNGGAEIADAEDSPLNAYMASIWGTDLSEEEQEAKFSAQQKDTEELVAQCMVDEGFEYQPNIQDVNFSSGSEFEWEPEKREWVTQYGYGIVNYPGRDEPMPDDQTYVDPNQDYVMSLSQSEQEAFYVALYGDQSNIEPDEDGSYEYDWTQGGCQGAAQHEVYENPLEADEFASLNDALNEFWTNSYEGPQYADIEAAWASCMADAGETGYQKQMDAQTSISDKLNAYYEDQTEYIENDPALDALGEEEIALAVVDLDCREATSYRAEYQKIQWELEEQFIADHKADLDAMKAAAEQAG